MGLFTGLLTLPIAPLRGVAWVAEQVTAEAERELYDEDRIARELLQLELDEEDGRISKQERYLQEGELFMRLREARERRRAAREWEEALGG